MVDQPPPFGQPVELGDPLEVTAEGTVAVDEMDVLHAATTERERAFHARRSAPDDEHGALAVGRLRVSLRMPPAPVLLADRRVLGADDRRLLLVARDADVAPDALADVAQPSLGDLARQERIGDPRSRDADEVDHAAADGGGHRVRADEAADGHDRLARRCPHLRDVLELIALVEEARRPGRVAPLVHRAAGELEVPEVDEMVGELDDRHGLLACRDTEPGWMLRLDREAHGDGAIVTHGVPDRLRDLEQKPRSVLERTAVLVGPPVVCVHQELLGDAGVGVRAEVDHVEADVPGAPGGVRVEALELEDLVLRHLVAGVKDEGVARHLGDASRDAARLEVFGVIAVEAQLDTGERAMLMDAVDHQREVVQIVAIPQPPGDRRPLVGLGVDRAPLGVHDREPALRLQPAMKRLGSRTIGPESGALRRRVEAVSESLGPDLDRLEEDVVPRISRCRVSHRGRW